MKLSKRLQKICDFIPNDSKVIDVGADHALVDIYLNKYKNCTCLATDISASCIQKCQQNILMAKADVQTLVTDGLNNINLTNEIIIIAGMGGHRILNILDKNITNDLIISSHSDTPLIRKLMYEKGYHIFKEEAVFEKKYYIITYYKYGKARKIDYFISPFLTNDYKYMRHLLNIYQNKYLNETKISKKIKNYLIINKIKKKVK